MGRFDMPDPATLHAREKVVLDHFHDEVRQEWDDVLATFPHPHYELIAMMTVHDGDAAVRRYYDDTRVAFPDQDHEIIAVRHSADASSSSSGCSAPTWAAQRHPRRPVAASASG